MNIKVILFKYDYKFKKIAYLGKMTGRLIYSSLSHN